MILLAEQGTVEQGAQDGSSEGGAKGPFRFATPLNLFFILMLVAIIVLTVFFRIPMLKFYGFYEPDGFYHYSVLRAAVNHGLAVQPYLATSGLPIPTKVTEPYGLYWVTLIPYAFLQYFGVSYYTVERLIPVLFGILDVLGAYLLSRYISKDKLFGILVMLFVALSGGDEARTSALIYRGDGFVAIFLLLALVAFLEVFRSESEKRKILFGVLSGISLGLCNLVFSGAAFAVGIYVLSFAIILCMAFVFAKKELIGNLKYVLVSLLVWFVITSLCLSAGWIQLQVFVGLQFFYIFIPMLLGWLVAYLLINRSELLAKYLDVRAYMRTALQRCALLLALLLVFVVIMLFAASSLIYTVFVNNGFITSGNANVAATNGSVFASTIQELQPPTPDFLFASFGINIYTTLPTLAVLYSSYISSYFNLIFIVVIIAFLPYFFMQVYDSGGLVSGRPRLMFGINLGMIVLLAYFLVTAYLQMHAIRFNSLISIPIALLSAYTLYWLISYVRANKEQARAPAFVAALLFVVFLVVGAWTQLSTLLPAEFSSSPAFANGAAALFAIAIGVIVLLKYWMGEGKALPERGHDCVIGHIPSRAEHGLCKLPYGGVGLNPHGRLGRRPGRRRTHL